MIKSCVEEINKQGATYKKHSNQWNVMQQLIDIVSDNPDISEVVYQDLLVEEMKLEKQKAVAEARTAAIEEAKAEFEEKIKSAEQEKADALKKAEQMAARLDKNADADLVKASLYFTEAQKQLESFSASLNKIKESDPDKADKLKQVVVNFLKEFIER